MANIIKKYKKKAIDIFFSDDLPIEAKKLNIVYFAGMIGAILSLITRFLMGSPYQLLLALVGIIVAIALSIYISKRFRAYYICTIITVVFISFILLPLAFFYLGGVYNSAASYFVLGIVIIFLLIRGRLCLIFSIIYIALACVCHYINSMYPDLIIKLGGSRDYLEQIKYIDSIQTIIIVGFCISTIILFQNKLNANEIRKTERANHASACLKTLSLTDELTKINNRRSFMDYMDIIWKQGRRLQLPITLLMIDIDYFKKYNDALGHLEGDKALIAIAQCMKNQLKRDTDFIARFGGEEFVCLLPYISNSDAVSFANTLVESVENMKIHHPDCEHSKYLTISAGLSSILPDKSNSYTQLLDEADKALYMAKQAGRNRIAIN
ncbi:MAG: diguanylate cyclase [Treponema sp.]|nr:diguanylate cyclase [Treponema sp.]